MSWRLEPGPRILLSLDQVTIHGHTKKLALVAIPAKINDLRATSKTEIQEGKQGGEEERVVAKSRPARNPVSTTLNRSATVSSSSSSERPGDLAANCSTLDSSSSGKCVAMDANKNNASGSQVWHADTDPNHWSQIVPSQFPNISLTMSSIWRKSSRTYDRNLVAQRKTKWSRTTPTQ